MSHQVIHCRTLSRSQWVCVSHQISHVIHCRTQSHSQWGCVSHQVVHCRTQSRSQWVCVSHQVIHCRTLSRSQWVCVSNQVIHCRMQSRSQWVCVDCHALQLDVIDKSISCADGNLLHLVQHVHPVNHMGKDRVLPCTPSPQMRAHVKSRDGLLFIAAPEK